MGSSRFGRIPSLSSIGNPQVTNSPEVHTELDVEPHPEAVLATDTINVSHEKENSVTPKISTTLREDQEATIGFSEPDDRIFYYGYSSEVKVSPSVEHQLSSEGTNASVPNISHNDKERATPVNQAQRLRNLQHGGRPRKNYQPFASQRRVRHLEAKSWRRQELDMNVSNPVLDVYATEPSCKVGAKEELTVMQKHCLLTPPPESTTTM